MGKKGFTIHIDEQIVDNFRTYCNLNALKVSAKVELLLQKELNNAKINPTLVEMFEKILDGQKILRIHKTSGQTKVTGTKETIVTKETTGTKDISMTKDKPIIKSITEETETLIGEKDTKEEETKVIKKEVSEEKSQQQKNVPTIEHLKRMKSI
tara:strand:+ start:1139 stop:1600 length:462 start_codon:yes stop_codon:yes gene_type:complete